MFLLSHKYQARLKKLARDKQSSLYGLLATDPQNTTTDSVIKNFLGHLIFKSNPKANFSLPLLKLPHFLISFI